MQIVVIEDDEAFSRDLERHLLAKGHSCQVFASPSDARGALQASEEPILIILDHDLGAASERGYEFCRWIRRVHPYGLILPIIYLTGRESASRFLEVQREDPAKHPSVFLSKADLATEPTLLGDLIRHYQGAFAELQELGEEQAARRALLGLHMAEPEPEAEQ